MSEVALPFLIFSAALLYSSVGHGGASAYLATMALANVDTHLMRPLVLLLNVMVASISLWSFSRKGWFSWSLFWPLALFSIPFAWLGGSILLPAVIYKKIIALVLIYSAYRLWRPAPLPRSMDNAMKRPVALGIGGGIGFLSGLTGVGGGIFLSPILILKGWSDVKSTSAVAAAFIVVNSISGLLAIHSRQLEFPHGFGFWLVAALAGGIIGSHIGSRMLTPNGLRRTLGIVLAVASIRLFIP
ncbi:MAG: sulfite exporter TauE/SafE family protein [Verrucomicrobia bacterium]|nr:sulfite exporter TauE/SafE family protein [Verrucomicrobiota bacterium]